jgi:dsRNA-specific ribonuclease
MIVFFTDKSISKEMVKTAYNEAYEALGKSVVGATVAWKSANAKGPVLKYQDLCKDA